MKQTLPISPQRILKYVNIFMFDVFTHIGEYMNTVLPTQNQKTVFRLLASYRWASLLPAIWLLWQGDSTRTPLVSPTVVLAAAVFNNLFITLSSRSLNRVVKTKPWLLGLDFLFTGWLLINSGGVESPYYLYALSPLLASAFFFQVRGALFAAIFYTPIYIYSSSYYDQLKNPEFFSQLAGIWLVTLFFSYPAELVNQLRQTLRELRITQEQLQSQNEELSRSHQQLSIIHDITKLIQAAPDVSSVQQQVLKLVTHDLGYSKAAIGLIDPATNLMGSWAAHPNFNFPEEGIAAMPLSFSEGKLYKIFTSKQPAWIEDSSMIGNNPGLNAWLSDQSWIVFPMIIQEHPVGILMIASDHPIEDLPKEELHVITSMASQAAVGLGTTLMCIDRARNLAVEQERNRIAREIHDTISQSLFGIVFSLDACVSMLPDQVEIVQQELNEIRSLASSTHEEIRHSILDLWPSQLDWHQFQNDLTQYLVFCGEAKTFGITFTTTGGDFDFLPAGIRRSIYRIAQEALANVSQHAGVDSADLSLDVFPERVILQITDKGCGFDPEIVMARAFNREKFGLHGIHERVNAVGGTMQINSQIGVGTDITVTIPLLTMGEML